MQSAHIQKWFTTPVNSSRDPRIVAWFSLSIICTAAYALVALSEAFSHPYVVQDDARQYIFWMRRFFDPELFPNDLIASYFESVSPWGYVTLYRIAATVGIDPLVFNKCLPLVLSLVTTGFFFGLTMNLLPVPFTGFAASLLLAQTMWMKDDIVSASPRSFVYPFFIAFLYFLTRYLRLGNTRGEHDRGSGISRLRSLLLSLTSITLLGLFYPQYLLVGAGLLLLTMIRWHRDRLRLELQQQDYGFYGLHFGAIFAVLLYYAVQSSDFDPVISAAQARLMPEFWPGGRSFFFNSNLWWFYLVGDRSGIFHVGLLRPATLCLGLLLPLLMRSPQRFPLVRRVKQPILLVQILGAAVGMWILAHALLFRLHLPSRYLDHSWRFVMSIAAAMVLTMVLDWILSGTRRSLIIWLTTGFITALLLVYPFFVDGFPVTKYQRGEAIQLYSFLAEQPKDTLVASVVNEVNNLPTFAQRSIYIGREYAIPYHSGYYNLFRKKAIDLIKAQYTPDFEELKTFIQTSGVDYWILDRKAYEPDYVAEIWIKQYLPEVENTIEIIRQGKIPALADIPKRCTVFNEKRLKVIDTACILERRKK